MIIDTKLYWIQCRTIDEANYLTAIINSRILEEAVTDLMSKGQFGSRDLHKHLWRLPIPRYDQNETLHREIVTAATATAEGAEKVLRETQSARIATGKTMSVTVARREIRAWLETSGEGKKIDTLIDQLLA